jgi:hypothetical protein
MTEEETVIPGTDMDARGQADEGSDGSQTTPPAPAPAPEGQPADGQGQGTTTEGAGTQVPPDDTFFDPRELDDKPELLAAYKNMQRGYTKKMEGIKEHQQKIDAYDAFYTNPEEQVKQLLTRMGMRMVPIGQQADAADTGEPYQPQSWDDAFNRGAEIAEERIMQKLKPLFGQFQNLRQSTIESQLSEIDPGWQQYEDGMKSNLQQHPTLANDPATLYRMSVPVEVLESRATQAALKKLDAQKQSSDVSRGSTTTKTPATGLPDKPVSFDEAVAAAKKVLADQGITPG